MTMDEFNALRGFLKRRSGHALTDDKAYFAEGRLAPVLKEFGMISYPALIAAVNAPGNESLKARVAEAMTINESFFFRDKTPFSQLAEVMVPALMQARRATRRIRIWSAAAATGQEPYSIAMQLRELGIRVADWQIDIVATDLSSDGLQRAKSGKYTQFEVQRGLPIHALLRHFKQEEGLWRIDPGLTAMIEFRQLNLLGPFGGLGRFDIVFCRNVLIYFEAATRKDILARIARQMAPDGYLVTGASESLLGLDELFRQEPHQRGVYRPAPARIAWAPAPSRPPEPRTIRPGATLTA